MLIYEFLFYLFFFLHFLRGDCIYFSYNVYIHIFAYVCGETKPTKNYDRPEYRGI